MTKINKKSFSLQRLNAGKGATLITEDILAGEIEGVQTQLVSIKGPFTLTEPGSGEVFNVLLSLKGKGAVTGEEKEIRINGEYIIRVPYGKSYRISAAAGDELYILRIRKHLHEKDKAVITKNVERYTAEYAKSFGIARHTRKI